MNIEEVNAVRIQSKLSERLHYVEVDSKRYLCVSGIALPYNIGVVFLLWAMAGFNMYSKIAQDNTIPVDLIQKLNPDIEDIQKGSTILLRSVTETFQNYIRRSTMADLNEIIPIELSISN